MPGYVNIGARVGAGSMVDTWATVGSCAQIGKDCTSRAASASAACSSRPARGPSSSRTACSSARACVIVEGVTSAEAVIGTGVVLTSSTADLDVTGPEAVEHRGRVPARARRDPRHAQEEFPAGEFGVPCALIIGKRSASTDRKVWLNAALRDFAVPV